MIPIKFDSVSRSYGDKLAVDRVSLSVDAGTVHCLLGPNGAGKTTLLRLMAGLVAPTGGTIEILGGDPFSKHIRSRIGWVPSVDRSFYMRISGVENLLFFARQYGRRKRDASSHARKLLEMVGLSESADLAVGGYSHGMTKRLAVARALIVDGPLYLVDEATHDLDIEGSAEVRAMFREKANGGATVVWSTHRLTELNGLVDTVTVLDRGMTRFDGDLDEMLSMSDRPVYRVQLRKPGGVVHPDEVNRSLSGVASVLGGNNRDMSIELNPDSVLGTVLRRLLESGFDIHDCYPETGLVERAMEARLRT